jgi:hypothetical protein
MELKHIVILPKSNIEIEEINNELLTIAYTQYACRRRNTGTLRIARPLPTI